MTIPPPVHLIRSSERDPPSRQLNFIFPDALPTRYFWSTIATCPGREASGPDNLGFANSVTVAPSAGSQPGKLRIEVPDCQLEYSSYHAFVLGYAEYAAINVTLDESRFPFDAFSRSAHTHNRL